MRVLHCNSRGDILGIVLQQQNLFSDAKWYIGIPKVLSKISMYLSSKISQAMVRI